VLLRARRAAVRRSTGSLARPLDWLRHICRRGIRRLEARQTHVKSDTSSPDNHLIADARAEDDKSGNLELERAVAGEPGKLRHCCRIRVWEAGWEEESRCISEEMTLPLASVKPACPLVRFLRRAESVDAGEWSCHSRGLQFSATTNQAISPGCYPPSYLGCSCPYLHNGVNVYQT
jgi:hypothetical protein